MCSSSKDSFRIKKVVIAILIFHTNLLYSQSNAQTRRDCRSGCNGRARQCDALGNVLLGGNFLCPVVGDPIPGPVGVPDPNDPRCFENCVTVKRRERRNRPIGSKVAALPSLPLNLLRAESIDEVLEIIEDDFPGGTGGAAVTGVGSLAALAPPPLSLFPPSGLPQPQAFQPGTFNLVQSSATSIGGGALPTSALANAIVATEISSLVAGLSGAVVVSVFASDLPGTFLLPRTVPATAALLTEPPITPLPRKTTPQEPGRKQSCPRPVLDLGAKLNAKQNKFAPVLDSLSKITSPFSKLLAPISTAKSRLYRSLGLECLFPRLIRPFESILKYSRCKLGLSDDGFMATPACNSETCVNATIETKEITRDRRVENVDFMVAEQVSTLDDCFGEMEKVTYSTRVLAKIVDDQPCDDPRYQAMCEEAIAQNRMILEDTCETPSCTSPNDDPFQSCFGCENSERGNNRAGFGNIYTIDRQTGEEFQATSQNRRVVCTTGEAGGQRCRLRIDRAMQLRGVSYGRALQFIHSEQYLSDEDVDLIRRYRFFKYKYL